MIRDGKIVSVDTGAITRAGTATRRGRASSARRAGDGATLVDTTRRAMRAGIAPRCRATTSATSRAPSRTSRRPAGYGIVRTFVGHGIGTEMHQDPQVPNYRSGAAG